MSDAPISNPIITAENAAPATESSAAAIPGSKEARLQAAIERSGYSPETSAAPPESLATGLSAEGPATSSSEEPATPQAPVPTPSELRKEYLAASKAKRQADAASKRAKDLTTKADKFQQAVGSWKTNPSKVLEDAGIDPSQFYQELTKQALQIKKEVDPVESKLEVYRQQLEEKHQAFVAEQVKREEKQAIYQAVLPVIHNNTESLESLLAYAGDNPQEAAEYVYQAIKDHYFQTGERVSIAEAAASLNNWHEQQFDLGIKRTMNMRAFSNRYQARGDEAQKTLSQNQAQSNQTRAATPSKSSEQPISKTLSNNIRSNGSNQSNADPNVEIITRPRNRKEARLQQLLSKYNLT